MKNRYAFRSRISEKKIREIVRCFSADLTALQTAELTGTKASINSPNYVDNSPVAVLANANAACGREAARIRVLELAGKR